MKKRFLDLKGYHPETKQTEMIQVGKQNKNGTPVSREVKALQDINKASGGNVIFVPYNNW